MSLSENIRNARLKAGLNQEELATMIGVKKATISLYENGAREPDALKIVAIAKALNVSGDYLLDFPAQSPQMDLSPEALALARRYDEIQDPLDRKMVECAVNIGLLRNAPHDARPVMPPMFSEEWFADRIYGEDPRVARKMMSK